MTPCGDKLCQVAEEERMQFCKHTKPQLHQAQALLLLLLLLLRSEAVCLFAWLQGGLSCACLVIHMLDHMVRLK